MTIIKSKFFKNFLLLTFSTLIINVVEMLTNIYITNKIGTTVLGSYSLIMNFFNDTFEKNAYKKVYEILINSMVVCKGFEHFILSKKRLT